MVINFLGDTSFQVKTKLTEITTGKTVRVGSIPLTGPGEYEVGDVQARSFPGAYLFSAEGINVLYIDRPNGLSEETAKLIEEDIDVVLLTVDSDETHIKGAVKSLHDLDPKLALPTVDSTDHPFCKEIGGCPQPVNELKITKKDLAEGELKVVVLHARTSARR